MRRPSRLRVLALVALGWIGLPDAPAAGDVRRVPIVPSRDLPAAGTCAPLRKGNLTHIMVGRKTEFGWYRVADLRDQILNDAQIYQVLKQRADASIVDGRSEHAVWITAARDHRWAHVVKVLYQCGKAGIYRVGLRVRHETTNRVLGFPLFLPAAPDAGGATSGTATEVPLRLWTHAKDDTKGRPTIRDANPIERDRPEKTNLSNVYFAAQRGVEKFGKVVAKVRLSTGATVQDAVRVLDLLYRGGCAGVRVVGTTMIANPNLDVYPVVQVGSRALGGTAPGKPPPIAPRDKPWPVDGANQPGWVNLKTTPMPLDAGATSGAQPNYAAKGAVPAHQRERSEASIRNWALGLSADLRAAARGGPQLTSHLLEADRRPELLAKAVAPVRTLAQADALNVTTLLVTGWLYRGQQSVGRVDFWVLFGPTRTQLVFARFSQRGRTDPPPALAADPFGKGTAGHLRIWTEALCLQVRKEGSGTLPMADPGSVFAAFPPQAARSMDTLIRRRTAELAGLVGGLREAKFDRVVLQTGRLGVSVLERGATAAVLYGSAQAEKGELRLTKLYVQRPQ